MEPPVKVGRKRARCFVQDDQSEDELDSSSRSYSSSEQSANSIDSDTIRPRKNIKHGKCDFYEPELVEDYTLRSGRRRRQKKGDEHPKPEKQIVQSDEEEDVVVVQAVEEKKPAPPRVVIPQMFLKPEKRPKKAPAEDES